MFIYDFKVVIENKLITQTKTLDEFVSDDEVTYCTLTIFTYYDEITTEIPALQDVD